MEKNLKRIKSIWRWEWGHDKRDRICCLVVELLLEFLFFAVYKLWKGSLFRVMGIIMQMPPWAYAFLGLDASTNTGYLAFFLFYMLMLINAWNIWKACKDMIWSMDRDESSGSIYLLCNQWFDRKLLALGKWSWNVAALVAHQTILYLWVLLLALIGSLNGEQRLNAAGSLAGGWCISIMVIILFVTLSFAHFALCRHRRRGDFSFRNRLFWIPLFIGNLYKIRNLVFAVLERLGNPTSNRAADIFQVLDSLYWLSPLSWLNVFVEAGIGQRFLQAFLCVCFSAAALFAGVRKYQKREFL